MRALKSKERLNEERLNKQGCLMRIIEYNNSMDIVVEFQDGYKYKTKTTYRQFCIGSIKNPYYANVYGVGMIGSKYSSKSTAKEYQAWIDMLRRCYDENFKKRKPTYQDVICCKEWLLFDNFYNWLHSQENFDKWLNGKYWALDKDILIKGNKIYSPKTCCLVPNNVNNLFTKQNIKTKKKRREKIKQVAQEEYDKCNITKECYEAMMEKVRIMDNRMNVQAQVKCMKDGIVGYRYRHFKGNIYLVTDIAVHSETEEPMVIYKNFNNPDLVWCRPLSMFMSEVDHEKYPDVEQLMRFERIGEAE